MDSKYFNSVDNDVYGILSYVRKEDVETPDMAHSVTARSINRMLRTLKKSNAPHDPSRVAVWYEPYKHEEPRVYLKMRVPFVPTEGASIFEVDDVYKLSTHITNLLTEGSCVCQIGSDATCH
jgi:hypothetical protein